MKISYKDDRIRVVAFLFIAMMFFSLSSYMIGSDFGGALFRRAFNSLLLLLCLILYFGRISSIGLLLAWLLCSLCYGFAGMSYGPPDRNAIAAFLFTNWSESIDFIESVPLRFWLVYFVDIILFWMSVCALRYIYSSSLFVHFKRGRLLLLLAFLSLSFSPVVKGFFEGDGVDFYESRLMEVRLPVYVYRNFKEIKEEDAKRSVFDKKVGLELDSLGTDACQVCVFVMGESARRDFMNAYGAPWDNTPWMSSTNGKIFTNVLSSANATAPSLSVSLYSYERDGRELFGNNIVSLANELGYETFWFSSQGRKHSNDMPASIVASFANHKKFVVDDLPHSDKEYPDFVLLNWVEDALRKNKKGKVFIVLHLLGSHPSACTRTGGEYDDFFVNKELSCYIKSIKNTDELLRRLSVLLSNDEDERSWGILYTSDHALGFSEGAHGWVLKHSTNVQDNFKVPLFITGSNFLKREVVTSQRSSRYLLHMVGNWLGVKVKGSEEVVSCDWLNEEHCQNQDKVRIGYGAFFPINTLQSFGLKDFIELIKR